MKKVNNTTLTFLLNKYGVLMTLSNLAEVLDRSTAGLRTTLSYSSKFKSTFGKAKIKRGRRIYFKTEIIAEELENDAHV